MELTTIWFIAIAVLWVGYFVLEGFDFGVGMLLPILGRNDRERRVLINTIGPVWDGNEVWVLVAGGATFAAFPDWYATMFSAFYIPLLAILVALIIRGVAFEYRGKRDDPAWRRRWDVCITIGSLIPALVWGVAFANLVRGLPIDGDKEFVGHLLDVLSPFALLGGVVTVLLFLTHGAVFLALKTAGDIRVRANRLAGRLGIAALIALVAFAGWLNVSWGTTASWLATIIAAVALLLALMANRLGREGWAFIGSAASIALVIAGIFLRLFPTLMPSTLDPAWSLTTTNASATDYTLTIMTWAAAFGVPLVLAYQGWTYWVFRRRLSVESIPG